MRMSILTNASIHAYLQIVRSLLNFDKYSIYLVRTFFARYLFNLYYHDRSIFVVRITYLWYELSLSCVDIFRRTYLISSHLISKVLRNICSKLILLLCLITTFSMLTFQSLSDSHLNYEHHYLCLFRLFYYEFNIEQ